MPRSSFQAVPRAMDANGNPVSGAQMFTYLAGTTTPVTVYSDLAQTTAHAFPIVADANGYFPAMYLAQGACKYVIRTPEGGTLSTADNVASDGGGWPSAAIFARATGDSSDVLQTFLSDASITEIFIPAGQWRFDAPVEMNVDRSVRIYGAGSHRTKIDLNHLGQGIRLSSTDTNPETFAKSVTMEGFSITRSAGVGYAGSPRPTNLSLVRYKDPVFRDIDSSGHIGYGVSHVQCVNPLTERVRSHDANGGAGGIAAPTGTDGIHHYHCDRPTAINCEVWNVGDDCISFGSLRDDVGTEMRTRDARAINCRVRDSLNGGGIKLYGHVEGARVEGLYAERIGQGAVYLTDHPDAAAYAVTDVTVDGVTAIDCQGPGATNTGVLRVRMVPGTAQTARFQRINFRNIVAVGCRTLLTMNEHSDPANHWIEDVFLDSVRFSRAAFRAGDEAGGYQANGVNVQGMRGILALSDVDMLNIIGSGVILSNGFDYSQFRQLSLRRFRLDRYGVAGGSADFHGVAVLPTDALTVELSDVLIRGQARGVGVAQAKPVLLTNLAPTSAVQALICEDGPIPDITGSYKTSDPRAALQQPSEGSWLAGDYVRKLIPGGGIGGWGCTVSGTYGTLSGVTASGTSGDRHITVNTAAGIRPGHVLSVVSGFPGARAVVVSVSGTTVFLNIVLTATFSGSALTFGAATWKVDPDPLIEQATAAQIASAVSTINTVDKFLGKLVWDSTNSRTLRTNGINPTSDWQVIDGSATVTPS